MFFSVIVPIYKIENYIDRCIESVLSQTFPDFELILVDDGSPDNCPKICDDYAKKDSRIKVIHKKNGGLVSARQEGIRAARGKYIFNLDGDDFITSNALKSAHSIISDTDADIVSFSYIRREPGKEDKKTDDLVCEGLYEGSDIFEKLLPHLPADKNMKHLFFFIWGKAIRRDIAYSAQLNVNKTISFGEDICCLLPCLMSAKKVFMSREAVYIYSIRNDSLTTDFKPEQISQVAEVINYMYTLPKEKDFDLSGGISRYSLYMTLSILAAAAEGKHFNASGTLKRLIKNSVLEFENKRAKFDRVTPKSAAAMYLIKHNAVKTAFIFLYLCKCVKDILGKRGKTQ